VTPKVYGARKWSPPWQPIAAVAHAVMQAVRATGPVEAIGSRMIAEGMRKADGFMVICCWILYNCFLGMLIKYVFVCFVES
jgi:hypothetical protein